MNHNSNGRHRPAAGTVLLSLLFSATAQAAVHEPSPAVGPTPAVSASPDGPRVLVEAVEAVSPEEEALDAKKPPRAILEAIGFSAPTLPGGSGTADWSAIAQCESGGRWGLNTSNGFWGGLQFTPETWFAYGGGPFDGVGPFPYPADTQIAVAERVLAGQGWQAWPNCFVWAR